MDFETVAIIGIGAYVLHRIVLQFRTHALTKKSYTHEVNEVLNNPAYKVKGKFEQ